MKTWITKGTEIREVEIVMSTPKYTGVELDGRTLSIPTGGERDGWSLLDEAKIADRRTEIERLQAISRARECLRAALLLTPNNGLEFEADAAAFLARWS